MLSKRRAYAVATTILLALVVADSTFAKVQRNAPVLDNWSESRIALHLAAAYRYTKDSKAACQALAASLDYYRMALAKDANMPLGELGSGLGNDDGMSEIRAKFGCMH